jgi:hypothetical protein
MSGIILPSGGQTPRKSQTAAAVSAPRQAGHRPPGFDFLIFKPADLA